MSDRAALVRRAMEAFGAIDGVISTYLRGSLAVSGGDRYSDIDIGVVFPSRRVTEAGRLVIAAMRSALAVEFEDWAPSLLPDSAVISFYLKDFPVFWSVDVLLEVPVGLRDLTPQMGRNDPTGHLLKLWTAALKHTIRNDPRCRGEIEKVWIRAAGEGPCPEERFAALRGALEAIGAAKRFTALVSRCSAELAAAANVLD